jgi:hypothetical protein
MSSRTGKNITSKDIQNVAKQVKPTTIQNEQQLRQLVHSVGAMAGVKVPPKLVNDIVSSIQNGALQSGQMEQMIRKMMNPKT